MTVSALNTLLVFLIGFGAIGLARGPRQEIWTLGGITLTILFLTLGGLDIIKQLPVRIASGFLSVSGNQDGSNSVAAHPLQDPWTTVMLWIGTLGLVGVSYLMGQFGKGKKDEKRDFGNYFSGFLLGMINGACVCIFLFSQGGFKDVVIQFPTGAASRTTIAPLLLVGLVVVIIAIAASRPKPADTPSK
ncbi:MAG: hypothetical protein H0X24_24225 [Ktedonobacterales bacterium]|nr:hypothetical protein [Ktedonobacterales bacterium]